MNRIAASAIFAASIALVLGAADSAQAKEASEIDAVGLLAILDGAKAIERDGLGVDVALATLKRPGQVSQQDQNSRGRESSETLGIGRLGNLPEHSYTGVYAGRNQKVPAVRLTSSERRHTRARFAGISDQVSECYGTPMSDNDGSDRVAVAVTLKDGRAVAIRFVDASSHGDADLDNCLRPEIKKLSFPRTVSGEVRYQWDFRFVAQDFDLD